MAKIFELKTALPTSTRQEIDRIEAIASGLRTTAEADLLTNLAPYLTNEVILRNAAGEIVMAVGESVPDEYEGFAKPAFFFKSGVADGTKAVYENVGTTTDADWNLVGATSTAEINDLAVTSGKLAAAISFLGKTLSLPTATPVNAVGSVGTLTLTGAVVEGETITIGGRVYEIDSDGSVEEGNVAVDVSGGAEPATGILTISGVVIDGESVVINGRVYEFDSDASITGDVAIDISAGTKTQSTTTLTLTGVVIDGETFVVGGETYQFNGGGGAGGNNEVDVTSFMTASEGTLTLGGAAPANNETMTVGATVYTWKTTLTGAADEIKIGVTVDDCIDNFVYAINAGIGAGTLYGTGTTANASVTAAKGSATTAVLTAIVAGTVGDAIVTTETMGDVANVFDAGTLGTTTAGVDCTAANADGAIITAFNNLTALGITATQGAGTTVDFDADGAGTEDGSAGNVASTETMANASFTGATMTGGSDATAAEAVTAVAAAITGDGSAEVTAADGAGDTVDLTAIEEGTVGNAITTTETMANGSFGAGTLAGGTDESAANAVTAIVAAITGDGSAVVSAADGAGDTVVVTALTKGVAGDAIGTTETLTNGSWGAATLENGVDGTVGVQWQAVVDSSYLYIAVAANTIAEANWRRVSLGAAF